MVAPIAFPIIAFDVKIDLCVKIKIPKKEMILRRPSIKKWISFLLIIITITGLLKK